MRGSRSTGSLVLNAQRMLQMPPKVKPAAKPPMLPEPTPVVRRRPQAARADHPPPRHPSDIPTPRMHDFGSQSRSLARWREKLWLGDEQRSQEAKWFRQRACSAPFQFTPSQRRELKRWFDFIDSDASGEIDVEELMDPLLSAGIAQNARDIKNLMGLVDRDGSGGIDFDEFLLVLRPPSTSTASVGGTGSVASRGSAATAAGADGASADGAGADGGAVAGTDGSSKPDAKSSADAARRAFADLQAQLESQSELSLPSLVTMQRRRFLMDTILQHASERQAAQAELKAQEEVALRNADMMRVAQLRKLRRDNDLDASRKLERMRALQAVVLAQVQGGMESEDVLPDDTMPTGLDTELAAASRRSSFGGVGFVSAGPSEMDVPTSAAGDGVDGGGGSVSDSGAGDDFVFNMKVKRHINKLNAAGRGMVYNPKRPWDAALKEAQAETVPAEVGRSGRPRGVEFVVPQSRAAAAARARESDASGSRRSSTGGGSDTTTGDSAPADEGGVSAAARPSSPIALPVTASTLAASGVLNPARRASPTLQTSMSAPGFEGMSRHLLSPSDKLAAGLHGQAQQPVVPLRSRQRVVPGTQHPAPTGVGPRIRVSMSAQRLAPSASLRKATQAKVDARVHKDERQRRAKAREAVAAKEAAIASEWAINVPAVVE